MTKTAKARTKTNCREPITTMPVAAPPRAVLTP